MFLDTTVEEIFLDFPPPSDWLIDRVIFMMPHLVLCWQCVYMCVVCVVIPFILDVRLVDVTAGVTQEEDQTGFLHLPAAVLALIFVARRIQPSLFLVDREVEFCVPTNQSFSTWWALLLLILLLLYNVYFLAANKNSITIITIFSIVTYSVLRVKSMSICSLRWKQYYYIPGSNKQ